MLMIRLWSLGTFVAILVYKRFLIPYTPPLSAGLLSDFTLILIMFVLSIRRHTLKMRILQGLIALGIILFNWMDVCVYMAVYYRLTYENFMANYSYLYLIPQFISYKIIAFTLICFCLLLVLTRVTLRLRLNESMVNYFSYVILLISGISYAYLSDQRVDYIRGSTYYLSTRSLTDRTISNQTREYVASQDKGFNQNVLNMLDGVEWRSGPVKEVDHPNIIIDLSESLSAVDSQYAGGYYNRMPKIDAMIKDGLLIKNMYSNGGISAQGLAALVLGVQTILTQGATEMITHFPPDKLAGNNIVAYAKAAGYRTIALTANPSTWAGVSEWFHAVGFDDVYDRESSIYAGYPRYTWNAPSDQAMFTEAMKIISKETGPYLLLIETLSQHLPYILPDPAKYAIDSSSLVNQIHFVDEVTSEFYQNLKSNGFFNNGILVIVGDHRRFEPLGDKEIDGGGYPVWGEKIVGGIIGKGITPMSKNLMPFTLRDMNILLHYFIDGKIDVSDGVMRQANLATQLGLDIPVAVTLTTQDDTGTYLIRDDQYDALMISIYGNVPFDKIPYPFYKKIVTYLVLNNEWLQQRMETTMPPNEMSTSGDYTQ